MFFKRIQKFTLNVSFLFLTLLLSQDNRRLAKNGCWNKERALTSKKRRFCLGFDDAHFGEIILIICTMWNNFGSSVELLLTSREDFVTTLDFYFSIRWLFVWSLMVEFLNRTNVEGRSWYPTKLCVKRSTGNNRVFFLYLHVILTIGNQPLNHFCSPKRLLFFVGNTC